jgi:histidinol-phosphate aminotransferase
MFQLQQWLRPNIAALQAYSSARSEFSGQGQIFLDANENAFGSPLDQAFNRYPDPLQKEIKAQLAQLKGLDPSQIFLGNGSDEAIDLLLRAGCTPGQDNIICLPPTYGMYKVQAQINGVEIINIPLDAEFQPQVTSIIASANTHTKILFLCSPNNPTGNCFHAEKIKTLLQSLPQVLVVVDEAYIDYAEQSSYTTQLAQYPNLVVLQTLSKAWGLAALRLGMAFGQAELIAVLNKIKYPYNINAATHALVLQALQKGSSWVKEKVAQTLAQRAILAEKLAALPFVEKVYPSDANFLLVKTTDAPGLYRHLLSQGVVVRNRDQEPGCKGCLRITIGQENEDEALVQILQAVNG